MTTQLNTQLIKLFNKFSLLSELEDSPVTRAASSPISQRNSTLSNSASLNSYSPVNSCSCSLYTTCTCFTNALPTQAGSKGDNYDVVPATENSSPIESQTEFSHYSTSEALNSSFCSIDNWVNSNLPVTNSELKLLHVLLSRVAQALNKNDVARINVLGTHKKNQAYVCELAVQLSDGSTQIALVDTGASCSVISSAFARNSDLMLNVESCNINVEAADGSAVNVHGKLNFNFYVNSKPFTQEVVVIDSSSLNIILGMDWLMAIGAQLDLPRSRLLCKVGEFPLIIRAAFKNNNSALSVSKAIRPILKTQASKSLPKTVRWGSDFIITHSQVASADGTRCEQTVLKKRRRRRTRRSRQPDSTTQTTLTPTQANSSGEIKVAALSCLPVRRFSVVNVAENDRGTQRTSGLRHSATRRRHADQGCSL